MDNPFSKFRCAAGRPRNNTHSIHFQRAYSDTGHKNMAEGYGIHKGPTGLKSGHESGNVGSRIVKSVLPDRRKPKATVRESLG